MGLETGWGWGGGGGRTDELCLLMCVLKSQPETERQLEV